jgi:hypothetical protein
VTDLGKASAASWWRELLLLGAAVAAGLVVGNAFLDGGNEPPAGAPTEPPPAGAEPVPGMTAATPRAEPSPAGTAGIGKTGTPPDGAAVFPDGTWLEPLNGVEKAPPFPGLSHGLYSPVVRITTNAATGLQWYVHADGSVSTTQMVPQELYGRKFTGPSWVVGSPVPTQPVR